MNKKWLFGTAIAAVTAISAISVHGLASDHVASMEMNNDGFDVQNITAVVRPRARQIPDRKKVWWRHAERQARRAIRGRSGMKP